MAFEEELRVLNFVLWLNYYYFVLLECFPLFLPFLTFLIKFALCNSGKSEEDKAFLKTRARGHGVVCVLGERVGQVTMKIVATTETISLSFIISGNHMTIKGFPGGAMPVQEM